MKNFTSLKSVIALQVAGKIASCDMTLTVAENRNSSDKHVFKLNVFLLCTGWAYGKVGTL